jgi:predicted cupin superfamily sugar epimerase
MTAGALISFYGLQPHPEGGYYKESYRAEEVIPGNNLPGRFDGDRSYATAIYFLLQENDFSAFHRINSDELWHFYSGIALNIYVIDPNGKPEVIRLGSNMENGEMFQAVVPAGCWFASEPAAKEGFSFVGCTVAPGFDFRDFELADRNDLTKAFPQHASLINRLCRS